MEQLPCSVSKASIYSLLASVALERLSIVETIHTEAETVSSRVTAIVSGESESVRVEELLQLNEHLDSIMKSLINKEIYIEGIMEVIDKALDKSTLR